jgi:DNA replication protein DnaC
MGLQANPDCDVCGGLGVVTAQVEVGHPHFGKTFSCPACHTYEKARQDNIVQMSRLDNYQDKTFQTFYADVEHYTDSDNDRLRIALTQAMKYAEAPEGWLILRGNSGAGKTHLAAAIAHESVKRGARTIFATVPDLLDHLRATYAPQSEVSYDERFDLLSRVNMLILDDLGAESPTPWAQEKLYQLIDHRYNAKLPTIITTNADLTLLSERLSSRILDSRMTMQITMQVPDFRRMDMGDMVNPEVEELSSLQRYPDKRFDTFNIRSPETAQLADDVRVARHYATQPDGWLNIVGGYGSGKTHLAAAIANEWSLSHRGHALLVTVADLLDFLRATFAPDSRITMDSRFKTIRSVPLLLLDDFRLSSKTPEWARDKLFQLIDYRYSARLPTVMTIVSTDKHNGLATLEKEHPEFYGRLLDPQIATSIFLAANDYRLLPR